MNSKFHSLRKLSNAEQDKCGNVTRIGEFVLTEPYREIAADLVTRIFKTDYVMICAGKSLGKKLLLKEIARGFGYARDNIVIIKAGAHVEIGDLLGNYVICDQNCAKNEENIENNIKNVENDGKSMQNGNICEKDIRDNKKEKKEFKDTNRLFKYNPGILVDAIINGHFLIIDSYENLSIDTIQFFTNIIDNKVLYLPNNSLILMHNNFRLISICSNESKKSHLMEYRWKIINFPEVTEDYLTLIIRERFKNLQEMTSMLISIYKYLNEVNHIFLRDFFRMCEFLSARISSRSSNNSSFRDSPEYVENSSLTDYSEKNTVKNLDHFSTTDDFVSNGLITNPLEIIIAAFMFLLPNYLNAKQDVIIDTCKFLSLSSLEVFERLTSVYKDSIMESKFISNKFFYIPESYYHILHNLKVCIDFNFPALLIGETGVGKTSLVQALAKEFKKKIIVINIGADSDISNSLGTVKHTKISLKVEKIVRDFAEDFTYINDVDNSVFIEKMLKTSRTNYITVLKAMNKVLNDLGIKKIGNSLTVERLKNRVSVLLNNPKSDDEVRLEAQMGVLTTALVQGDWVLFDEINLAQPDTLSLISHIMENNFLKHSSILTEEPVKINKDFRFFACMNPANDVGKKALPDSLMKCFIRLYVHEIVKTDEIRGLVSFYLQRFNNEKLISDVQKFYIDFRDYFRDKSHIFPENIVFTRQLCRAMKSTIYNANFGLSSVVRESLTMCFLTKLSDNYLMYWQSYLSTNFGNEKMILNLGNSNDKLIIEEYPITKGCLTLKKDSSFILTDIVKMKITALARIVSLTNLPILLEGETAAGKTSLVIYLAQITGNGYVRINNHEHTDIQDYLGSYILSSEQIFTFKEGALLKAMRNGHWVIIDELNLASSDVLEMLNRLLDDNREIFVEELQEYVKAHKNFRIFATQNPSQSYTGRKQLSRAFRSRFIELDFSELSNPDNIYKIIEKRFQLKQINAKYMIDVLKKLSLHRKNTQIFSGRYGFITIRDLIKWCQRLKNCSNMSLDKVAVIGFHLLSSRCRDKSDISQINNIFTDLLTNKKFLQSINYTDSESYNNLIKFSNDSSSFKHLVWTKSLLRNGYYLNQALSNHEPVLLVGDTGAGKTTLCQLYAQATKRQLFIYNCHSNTESSDVIGFWKIHVKDGRKEFIWQDGPLIQSMKCGGLFVLDEISLADDSVIERINSVLENDFKSLILYEKFSMCESGIEIVKAHKNFLIVATMNPSGDYGKRELSYALRNRFTEIWCHGINSFSSFEALIQSNMNFNYVLIKIDNKTYHTARFIIAFFEAFKEIPSHYFSVRKILSLIYFVDKFTEYFHTKIKIISAVIEGFKTLFCDSFDLDIRNKLYIKISSFLMEYFGKPQDILCQTVSLIKKELFCFQYFPQKKIHVIEDNYRDICNDFEAESEEIYLNLNRIKIAMLYQKPIMLEGPPGSGKTMNVSFISKVLRRKLYRINFCEQTEISDIVGSFLPVFKNNEMTFEWVDGPFLEAIKNNGVILLDEINLACQTVIEGLNSCFDHRSNIYVPELDKTYPIDRANIFIFATQNPQSYIGRKGLPRSFLDRFIILNLQNFSNITLKKIFKRRYPYMGEEIILKSIDFITTVLKNDYAQLNFNIRDVSRHFEYLFTNKVSTIPQLKMTFFITFFSKITFSDELKKFFTLAFNNYKMKIDFTDIKIILSYHIISSTIFKIFNISLPLPKFDHFINFDISKLYLLPHQFKYFGILSVIVKMKWPCLITGSSMSGKTSIFKILSLIHNTKAYIVSLTSQTDSSDLIGDYNYVDFDLKLKCKLQKLLISLKSKNISTNISLNDLSSKVSLTAKLKSILNKHDTFINVIIQRCLDLLKISECDNKIMNIKWCEGILIKCIRKGYWICFDNINFCNSAIIDRLNSLLEPNGTLQINYKTNLQPHYNFRFFGIFNPSLGEISPALRNRCFEVHIDDDECKSFENNYKFIDSYDKFPPVRSLSQNITHMLQREIDLIGISVKPSIHSELIKKVIFIENSLLSDIFDRYQFLKIDFSGVKNFIEINVKKELTCIYSNSGLSLDKSDPVFIWSNRILWCLRNASEQAVDNQIKFLFLLRYQIFHQHVFDKGNPPNNICSSIKSTVSHVFQSMYQLDVFPSNTFCIYYIFLLVLGEIYHLSFNSKIERTYSIFNNFYQIFYNRPEFSSIFSNFNNLVTLIGLDNDCSIIYHYLYSDELIPFFKQYNIFNNNMNLVDFGGTISLENYTNNNSKPEMNHLLLFKYLTIINNKSLHDIGTTSNLNGYLLKKTLERIEYFTGTSQISTSTTPLNIFKFKLISRFILNDFKFDNYTPFCISEKSDFKELLKNSNQMNIIERFLDDDFPFAVSCMDCSNLKKYIDEKSIEIFCNFNIYTSWNKILSNITTEALEYLIIDSLKIFNQQKTENTIKNIFDGVKSYFQKSINVNDLIENFRSIYNLLKMDITENKLSAIGAGFTLLGILLLKIYQNLPVFDPNNRGYFSQNFYKNIIEAISHELESRFNFMNMFVSIASNEYIMRYDKSYTIMDQVRSMITSFESKRNYKYRDSQKYIEFKLMYEKSISNVFKVIKAQEISPYLLKISSNLRIDISNKYSEFRDLIEPLYTSLIMLEIGQLLKQPIKHDIFSIGSLETDTNDELSYIAGYVLEIHEIIIKYNRNEYSSKNHAIEDFYHIIKRISKFIKEIFQKIDFIDTLKANSFTVVQPEIAYEYFEPDIKPIEKLSLINKNNKKIISRIASKFAFYILNILGSILSSDKSIANISQMKDKNKLYINMTSNNNSSVTDQILYLSILKSQYENFLDQNISKNTNIYEYGYAAYAIKISSAVSSLHDQLLKMNISSSIIDEIFTLISQIKSLDVSCPLIIFLNRLDKLYQSMENLILTVHSSKLHDSITLIKNIIIEVRQVQFDCWPSILNDYDNKCIKETALIYFEVFDSLETFINSDNTQFPQKIQSFIENQSLATFEYSITTIKLLLRIMQSKYSYSPQFSNCVNFISYYEQFFTHLKSYRESHTNEIHKSLLDFSKLSKWRDFNYWSIKESSSQAHKTLHKYVKKYQVFVDQPINILIKSHSQKPLDTLSLEINTFIQKKLKVTNHQGTYFINENIKINYDTMKICSSISQKLFENCTYILDNIKIKFSFIKDLIITYLGNSKKESIFNIPSLNHELQKLHILNRPKSQNSIIEICIDINTFRGPIEYMISKPYKEIITTNNSTYMRGLYIIQKIIFKITKIETQTEDLTKINIVTWNIFKNLCKQRNSLIYLFKIYENIKQIDHIFTKFTIGKSNLINLSEKYVQNIFIKLSKITDEIDKLRNIIKLTSKIDENYSSPYFPNAKINHNIVNNSKAKIEILGHFSCISNIITEIITIFNDNISFRFILVSVINDIKDKIVDCIKKLDEIRNYMEVFSLFSQNTLTDFIKYIDQIFSQILDELNTLKSIKTKFDPNKYNNDIQILCHKLLISLQTITPIDQDFKHEYINSFTELFIKSYSEFNEEYILSLCQPIASISHSQIFFSIHELIKINLFTIENYIQFHLRLNSFYSFLFYLLSEAFLKTIDAIDQSNLSECKNENAQKNSEITEEAEKAGFHDGKGHDDVTDKIPDQDVFEDAIPKDELFDSSPCKYSDQHSEYSEEGSNNGIEVSDIETNFEKYCEKLNEQTKNDEMEEELEDALSSVSQSVCNELNPDVWNQEMDSEENFDDIQTEVNKIEDGEKTDTDDQQQDLEEMEMSFMSDKEEDKKEIENNPDCLNENIEDISISDHETECDNKKESEGTNGNLDGKSISDATDDEMNHENFPKDESLNVEDTNQDNTRGFGSKKSDKWNELDRKENLSPTSNKRTYENKNDEKIKIKRTIDYKYSENENKGNIDSQRAQPSEINNDAAIFSNCKSNNDLERQKISETLVNNPLDNNFADNNLLELIEDDTKLNVKLESTVKSKTEDIIVDSNEKDSQEKVKCQQVNEINFYEFHKLALNLAISLGENLRIILEPTRRTKFQGNYKSGRKINFRKIIPYIASKYTKDKIWLRRIKPHQREYKVILAIDDSSSMRDNETRKIALISLLTISTAFRLIEIGKVSVVSFGESVKTLLDFNDSLNEEKERAIWNSLNFHQSSTRITSLLQHCKDKFSTISSNNNNELEKLLIIISDGRGVFSQGDIPIKNLINDLKSQNILVIFIIMDNTNARQSISQINVPIFNEITKAMTIKSYLELFPFQYYLILKDPSHLPEYLGNITRQWIQLTNQ